MSKRKFDETTDELTATIFNDESSASELDDEDGVTNEENYTAHFVKHESDSGEDVDDEEIDDEQLSINEQYFSNRNRTQRWYKTPVVKSKQKSPKISSAIIGDAVNVKTALQAWHLFFTPEMLDEIVQHTNVCLKTIGSNYDNKYFLKPVTRTELIALIGLLYMSASLKSSRLHLKELWNDDGSGVELFRIIMPMTRFQILLRALTFDDVTTSEERTKNDRLAPIRNIFDTFVDNCKRHYSVGQYVTVEEKLEPYRGKCSFVQYMPHKRTKHGIKLFVLIDCRTYYISNIEVYTGEHSGPYFVSNAPGDIVERMIQTISGTSRNVTLDKSFTSYELMMKLLEKHRLTAVGAVRKTEPSVPFTFVKTQNRPQFSTIFGFQNNMTLVSYMPKKNKNMIVMSTMHHDNSIDCDTGDSQQPEIISLFNLTKKAIDSIDNMCYNYDVSRNSRRWPLTLFYGLLNIAGINSQIIYTSNTRSEIKRRKYLKMLCMEMVENFLKERALVKNLPADISTKIRKLAGNPDNVVRTVHQPSTSTTRSRCRVCPRKRNRKTRFVCATCRVPICIEHIVPTCMQCYENHNVDGSGGDAEVLWMTSGSHDPDNVAEVDDDSE